MIKESVSLNQVVGLLNELIDLDNESISMLLSSRVPCNTELANHPTVQVRQVDDGRYEVGVLGILNGMFGIDQDGWGGIVVIFDEDAGLPIRAIRADEIRINKVVVNP